MEKGIKKPPSKIGNIYAILSARDSSEKLVAGYINYKTLFAAHKRKDTVYNS